MITTCILTIISNSIISQGPARLGRGREEDHVRAGGSGAPSCIWLAASGSLHLARCIRLRGEECDALARCDAVRDDACAHRVVEHGTAPQGELAGHLPSLPLPSSFSLRLIVLQLLLLSLSMLL